MANGTPDAQIAALAQRVTGLENTLGGISAQLATLQSTINDRSRTPWGTLISAMGVLIVIIAYGGNLALAPVIQNVQILRDQANSTVPRGEHERVWASQDARYLEVNRRIDEIRADFAGVYGIRDVIREIQDNQKRLQQELYQK